MGNSKSSRSEISVHSQRRGFYVPPYFTKRTPDTSRFAPTSSQVNRDAARRIVDNLRAISSCVVRVVTECRWMRARGTPGGQAGRLEGSSWKNMVHEGTGPWHAAGFNASRWLMIVIHGYRATTLVLYVLLNVLVRTGEYKPLSDSLRRVAFVFPRVVCARSGRQSGTAGADGRTPMRGVK